MTIYTNTLDRVSYQRNYDYANRCLRTDSLDAGVRRTILDAARSPIKRRSAAGLLWLATYDPGAPAAAYLIKGLRRRCGDPPPSCWSTASLLTPSSGRA